MAWSRASRHERGYGTRWDKLRKLILARDKHLCQPCLSKGKVTAATQVDHIKAKAHGGTDDPDNLRAICKPCHDDKTTQDAGGKVRVRIGPDGWPVETESGTRTEAEQAVQHRGPGPEHSGWGGGG